MAQRILGVDLGAYTVKMVELETGFRQSKVRLLREQPLVEALPDEDPEGLPRRLRTLRQMADQLHDQPDVVALALGDELTVRIIEVPFQDARKIDQVIGFELESQILGELDGLVVDQVLAEAVGDGARVLAVGAEREKLQQVIAALAERQLEPRYVGAGILSYAALLQHALPSIVAAPVEEGEQPAHPARSIDVVVDLGHRSTRVAFVEQGRTLFARTISRGGADVTAALADTYRLEPAAAERAKHGQAQLLPDDLDQIIDPARRKLDSVLRDALRPLLRDLRQTFSAARSQGEPAPQRLVLVGGGARLNGLAAHLSRELAVPLAELAVSTELLPPEVAAEVTDLPSVALGMAFGVGLSTGTQVNLRKGALVFHNDYSYLRGKATSLALGAIVVLACLGLNAYASLHAMHKESDVLQSRLRVETAELFGTSKTDGKAVIEELRRGPQNGSPPVPSMTAFDVLDEITARLPPKDRLTLDVLELDIKPKKTFMKATAGSAKEIDLLVEALKQIDCFTDIQKGKVATIPGPATDGGSPAELKQFTLTIETTCP